MTQDLAHRPVPGEGSAAPSRGPTRLKVMTILGTRPEIIRLSRVMAALDRHCAHIIVHTGQNYDFELNEVFFQDLAIRPPDHHLGVAASTIGQQIGNILIQSEQVLLRERPDAVLILGDTNSALAAIVAKRLRIPIYHMEAGNRCFDLNVPEEINRRIVDHLADFNLVYTEHARRHLIAEGLPQRRIYLTGSPMREVLGHYRSRIEASPILDQLSLTPGGYFLVSAHREENVDNPDHLRQILTAMKSLADSRGMPVLVSTHPRTRKRLADLGIDTEADSRLRFMKPFGFLDYNKLQMRAFCTLSDSGTIAEESAILGFPAVTIRTAMERPEALDTGSIVITGLDETVIINAVTMVADEHRDGLLAPVPADYEIGNVSQRVVRLILGTAKLSNRWHGITTRPQAG
jgi:UDP-N-acetylglucosamine 2-epimerase (non-hydrolysing)